MSSDITLSAQKREVLGKQVRALRSNGLTPAVVHQRGEDSLHISIPSAELKKVYASAGKHHAVKLDVDGKKYTTIIKEMVNAPASSSVLHTVFQAIKEDEKVSTQIPLKLIGEIPAERASLLVLKNLDHIMVEALPKDLIDVAEVDASSLEEVGDKLHISDINLPNTIMIKDDPGYVIATVEMPKDQIAEADAALEEQKAQEGEPAEGEEPAEDESADVPAEHGSDGEGGQSEGEIRPGGKKEFEDKSQGHNPEKK